MKKISIILVVFVLLVVSLSGCTNNTENEATSLEIRETKIKSNDENLSSKEKFTIIYTNNKQDYHELLISEMDSFKQNGIWYVNYIDLGDNLGVFSINNDSLTFDNGIAIAVYPLSNTSETVFFSVDNKKFRLDYNVIQKDNVIYVPIEEILSLISICKYSGDDMIMNVSFTDDINILYNVNNIADNDMDKDINDTETLPMPEINIVLDLSHIFIDNTYTITYETYVSSEKKVRCDVAWDGDIDFGSTVFPYVNEGSNFESNTEERFINYNLKGNDEFVSFGYKIDITSGSMELGTVENDVAFITLRNNFDINSAEQYDQYIKVIKPKDKEVFMPFEVADEEKNIYYIPQGSDIFNPIDQGGNIVICNPDTIIETYYGDHKLVMLGKGVDKNHISFKLTQFTYDKLMNKMYLDNYDYLSYQTTILYLDQSYKSIRQEGYQGGQIEIVQDYDIVATKDTSGFLENQPVWLLDDYPGVREPGKFFIHQLSHATGDSHFFGWWSGEGFADFLIPIFLFEYGILNDSMMVDAYASVIDYYNSEIVSKDIDIPIHIFLKKAITAEELESKYAIEVLGSIEFNNGEFNELAPGKQYQWASNGEYSGWFVYEKGALIFLYINEYILHHTNNEQDLFDALNQYLTQYKTSEVLYLTDASEIMESVISEMTNTNFMGFFANYVLDNKPLPIEVIDGKIVVSDIND